MDTRRFLCLRCSEVAHVDLQNLPDRCPACGEQSIPADLDRDTVTVEVTWHELRCLVMWAEWWAGVDRGDKDQRYTMQRVVAGIADRIYRQHLDKAPLTFTGELAELRATFPNIVVHGVNELPPDIGTG